MFQTAVAVVENSDSVPKLWLLYTIRDIFRRANGRHVIMLKAYLRVRHVIERLLVRTVSLLEVVDHQVAVACSQERYQNVGFFDNVCRSTESLAPVLT